MAAFPCKASFQLAHRKLLAHLVGWNRGIRVRGYKVTIARLLEAEAKDEQVHLEQIRKYASSL